MEPARPLRNAASVGVSITGLLGSRAPAIDTLLTIVGRVAKVKLDMGGGPDHSKAMLDVQLNMEAEQTGDE